MENVKGERYVYKRTKEKSMKGNGGVGFVSLLTVLFIGLKLTGNITWSWWWVFSPMWIEALFILLLIFVVSIVQTFRG